MQKRYSLMLLLVLGLFCVSSVSGQSTYRWNGSVSSDWGTAANWTRTPSGTGVPSSTDRVIFNTTPGIPVFSPALAAPVTVRCVSMDIGSSNFNFTLSGHTLTVIDTVDLKRGKISSGLLQSSNCKAAIFGVNASPNTNMVVDVEVKITSLSLLLRGATFHKPVNLIKNGISKDDCFGNNLFKSVARIRCAIELPAGVSSMPTDAGLNLARNASDIFENAAYFSATAGFLSPASGTAITNHKFKDVYIEVTGGSINIGYNTRNVTFEGNLHITQLSGGEVTVTNTSATGQASSVLTTGAVKTSGFTGGRLILANLTQVQPVAGFISGTGTAGVDIRSCNFAGALYVSAPNPLFRQSTFKGTSTFEKTSSGSTTPYPNGGNTFTGKARFINAGTGTFRLAHSTADVFNSDATFINAGTGRIEPSYSGNNRFEGNIYIKNPNGTIQFALATGAEVSLTGANPQVIRDSAQVSSKVPEIMNLSVSKSGSSKVHLEMPVQATKSMTFTNGLISTGTHGLLKIPGTASVSEASNLSHVDGRVEALGAASFCFPIGSGGWYHPLFISGATAADDFVAQYFGMPLDPSGSSYLAAPNLGVDSCQSWSLTRTRGLSTTPLKVTLSWNNSSPCEPISMNAVRVVQWKGQRWEDAGNTGISRGVLHHTVTSETVLAAIGKIEVFVTGFIVPKPVVSSRLSYCKGEPIDSLRASAELGQVSWYKDAALTQFISRSPAYLPSPVLNGTNTVYAVAWYLNYRSAATKVDLVIHSPTDVKITGLYSNTVNSTIDEGETLSLEVLAHGPGTLSYRWTTPSGQSFSGASVSIPAISTRETGTYRLVIAPAGGCSLEKPFYIKVNPVTKKLIPPVLQGHDSTFVFSTFKPLLDEAYSHSLRNGRFYFKAGEKHQGGKLNCRIYNWSRYQVGRVNIDKRYGMNWYGLDLRTVCDTNQYYVMEVFDEHERKSVLRFKYVLGATQTKIHAVNPEPVCRGSNVAINVAINGGTSPYKVEWFVSNTQSSFASQPLYTETTSIQSATYTLNNVSQTTYVKVRVTDACNPPEEKIVSVTTTECPGSERMEPQSQQRQPGLQLIFTLPQILSPQQTPKNIPVY